MGLYVFNWPISVLDDWKDISIAHVIIIIKSEVSTFPIVIIFFRDCVPEMFVTSYYVTYCIYVPGKPEICFHYHWTYKMPVRYILSSVRVRLSTFSPLSIVQYVGLHVFSPVSLVMIETIYILCLIIIIKSEVWTITHCLGLGHETMVSAACLSILLHNFIVSNNHHTPKPSVSGNFNEWFKGQRYVYFRLDWTGCEW